MLIDIKKYSCLIFDCDGVILDSNKIKTEAFYTLALPYGKNIADLLVDYHTHNGGISRYLKIKYLIEVLLKRKDSILEERLVKKYGDIVYNELLNVNFIDGFSNFIESFGKDRSSFILSGGDQAELHRVFQFRNMSQHFIKILGSPTSKYENVKTIISDIKVDNTILFGDSKLDYEVANHFGFDFVFIYEKTEFKSWELFFSDKNILCIKNWNSIL
jgi:beta-phosphoglucomutase-like phosphatase (HAD superfamily)